MKHPTRLYSRTNTFNILLNDLLYLNKSTNTHNYADDNVLSGAANSVNKVINTYEIGDDEALSWVKSNFIFANLDRFKAIISRKNRKDIKNVEIRSGKELIKSKEHFGQYSVNFNFKLSWNLYISELIEKASAKLNTIKRMGYFLSKSKKISLWSGVQLLYLVTLKNHFVCNQ